ncbi:hypothetical protein ACJJTC_011466 [Scirpophaga incertulas]
MVTPHHWIHVTRTPVKVDEPNMEIGIVVGLPVLVALISRRYVIVHVQESVGALIHRQDVIDPVHVDMENDLAVHIILHYQVLVVIQRVARALRRDVGDMKGVTRGDHLSRKVPV